MINQAIEIELIFLLLVTEFLVVRILWKCCLTLLAHKISLVTRLVILKMPTRSSSMGQIRFVVVDLKLPNIHTSFLHSTTSTCTT